MQILLLAGSFHSRSFTQALLGIISGMLPKGSVTTWPIEQLPFYSEDVSGEVQPKLVQQFLTAVDEAHGILFCTPEYNHSIPAVLKNAIDWASRPAFQSPLKLKPVTIVTQADSPVGGARAQAHLKLILDSTLSRIHPSHEMVIGAVAAKFDQDMRLTDDTVRWRLQRHIDDFMQFVASVGAKPDVHPPDVQLT